IEGMKNLLTVGIVGSYGKTSTKEFLFKILSRKFNVLKTKNHQNSEIAIAKTVLEELKKNHQVFIAEIGAYNKGQVAFLAKIIQPKVGLITGVNEQHLATFGSMENLLASEGGGELINFLSEKNGFLFLNGNNFYCQEIFQKKTEIKKIITFVAFPGKEIPRLRFDFLVKDIKIEKLRLDFEVETKKEKMRFSVRLPGFHHLENLILAIACAREFFKISWEEIREVLENISPQDSSFKFIETKKGFFILDSTYSANPQSVISHLDYLSLFEKKKILVFPGLIELGRKTKEIHEKIGEKIGQTCDLLILTNDDFLEEIKKGIQKYGWEKGRILLIEDPKKIFEKIREILEAGDVVLLEGRMPSLISFLLKKYGFQNH
ncbi:MAG: Mur ligase family protein, partial [Minisyncoccales bacterium]